MKKAALLLILLLLAGSVFGAVTSVDKVQYDSNSDFFDGETLLLGFVSDFSTETISVHLDEDELSDATGKEVRDDIQLDVVSQNSYLEYGTKDIDLTFGRLYAFKAITHTEGSKSTAVEWGQENCFQTDPSDSEWEGVLTDKLTWTGVKYKVWCVRDNGYYGQVASLKNPATIYSTEWELQAGGKTVQRATISNQEQGSRVRLGDHAVITNIGGLTSGARKPTISNVYAIHSNSLTDNWRLIYRDRYDTWTRFVQNNYEQYMVDWAKGNIDAAALEREANSRAENAYEPATQTDIYNGATVEDTSWSSGQFKYDTNEELVFPRFNVYIEAGENGYITIEKPVGQAKITSSEGAEFGEFDSGTIAAEFENVASVEGSFSGSVSCSDPFAVDGVNKQAVVGAGERHRFEFLVSFASGDYNQQSIDGSCTITVTNSEGQSTSADVEVTGKQMNECVQGNEVVKIRDGTETILVCTDGVHLEKQDGDAVCGDGESATLVGTNNGLNDYECKKGTGSGGTPGEGSECVLFSFGQENPFTPSYTLVNPLCGADSPVGQLAQILQLFFAVLLALVSGGLVFYAVKWVDGEARVGGSFDPFKNRKISRFKRGSVAKAVVVGLVAVLVGFILGVVIPLWFEILVFIAIVLLAWIVGRFR